MLPRLIRLAAAVTAMTSIATARPNVLVILADDQGWGDLSLNGNLDLRTPSIDSLAAQGVRFERFFVQPVCAPTRAEFLTGRFFSRTGVRGVSTGDERMDPEERTLAEVLRDAGYRTAAFGKWHNGSQSPYHPNDQGFETFHGFTSGHWGDYFDPTLEENGKLVRGEGYITDHLTNRAIQFISENRARPFFCYLPLCTPHSPMQVPDRFHSNFKDIEPKQPHWQNKSEPDHARAALAMVENIDWNVGRLLTCLSDLGLQDNTVVLYFSDNGPNGWRWNGEMRGIKGSVDEGGVRVPCLVRWPAAIPPGTRIDTIAGAIDLLPTLAAATGAPLGETKPLDGINLLPLLRGETPESINRLLVTVQRRNRDVDWSVRGQRFRLTKSGGLFDPVADPRQRNDLTGAHPAEASAMRAFAEAYLKEVAPALGPDRRPFTVGYSPVTWLPARDGVPHGGVRRSGNAPNCSFFTRWTSTDDAITWNVEPGRAGRYEAWLHYTCPGSSTGSVVELSFGETSVQATIDTPFDPPLRGSENDRSPRHGSESFVKDFRPLRLGIIDMPARHAELRLRALHVAGEVVADVRWVELRRTER
jgi:arylsulfatase A-like enzyme